MAILGVEQHWKRRSAVEVAFDQSRLFAFSKACCPLLTSELGVTDSHSHHPVPKQTNNGYPELENICKSVLERLKMSYSGAERKGIYVGI